MELPQNKPSFNGKFKTKESIKNAIYKLLMGYKVEGRYSDDNWAGINKLNKVLDDNGIEHELLDSNYEGHGQIPGSDLPTKKVYRYQLSVRNKEGKNIPLFLKVTCAFIGKTGTMADKEYEITYYFF